MVAALQKYEHRSPSNFPTFNVYESWLGADLMIKGLKSAGKNPTRASVIKALRNVKSYNGNGLLPVSINYTNNFGHDLPRTCEWILRAQKPGSRSRARHPPVARTCRAPRLSPAARRQDASRLGPLIVGVRVRGQPSGHWGRSPRPQLRTLLASGRDGRNERRSITGRSLYK